MTAGRRSLEAGSTGIACVGSHDQTLRCAKRRDWANENILRKGRICSSWEESVL